MQVDWRLLLNEVRVPWRDRGANCSRGNINIRCPWCANDPSEHLRISETTEAYFCLRMPKQHSGKSFRWLLQGLKVGSTEIEVLLRKFSTGYREPEPEPEPIPLSVIQRGWDRFTPASESLALVDYVRSRGFPNPLDTISRYDLRWSREGVWAQRLLIPFFGIDDPNQVIAWTGRAVRASLQPRYKAMESPTGTPLFAPELDYSSCEALVVTEGPMDALALSDSFRRSPEGAQFAAVAVSGKQMTPSKLLAIRTIVRNGTCQVLLLAADADVSTLEANSMLSDLASAAKPVYYARARLPGDYKDPAEIPSEDRIPWLQSCLQKAKRDRR